MTTKTVLLVHGAWHGAWCWATLQAELDRRGVPSLASTSTCFFDVSFCRQRGNPLEGLFVREYVIVEFEHVGETAHAGTTPLDARKVVPGPMSASTAATNNEKCELN